MDAARPILIVEDDPVLCESLGQLLAGTSDLRAQHVDTCSAAREILLEPGCPVLGVILDVALPDGDGRDLCASLRQAGQQVPVIMLTGAGDEEDVVRGLDAGANDYVLKPFRASVLMARLRAQLRLAENSEAAVLPVGPYIFKPADKLLVERSTRKRVRLTRLETRLMQFLFRSGPSKRATLMREVWGYAPDTESHTLETLIHRLRIKAGGELLVTENGGYRLNLDSAKLAA